MKKPERRIVDKTLAKLNALPNCCAVKTHGGPFGKLGTPDIWGSFGGYAFVIEMKSKEGKISRIQLHRLRRWRAAGAIAGAARTPNEAFEVVALNVIPQPETLWRSWI